MKIDFTQTFQNLNGEVIENGALKKPLTLGDICVEGLLTVDKDDMMGGVEKVERYNLALEIHQGKKEGLSAEEVVLLKKLVGKYYTPIIVGQAFPMLEG